MASVDKQSLREEFNSLNRRFVRLCAKGQMAAESRALFQAMLMLFELLMDVFMDKHTAKDSTNSSKPSSQIPMDDTAITRSGTHGKGKAHNEVCCSNTRTVETVQVAEVHACESCGEDLSDTVPVGQERRTRIDIIFEKIVSHVDAQINSCPQCGAQTKGQFPTDMSGPLQYGLGIQAYALNLLIAQTLSLKRVQQSIRTLIGLAISETTILKYVMQLGRALEAWEQSAI